MFEVSNFLTHLNEGYLLLHFKKHFSGHFDFANGKITILFFSGGVGGSEKLNDDDSFKIPGVKHEKLL